MKTKQTKKMKWKNYLSRFFDDISHTLDAHFHVWNRDVFEKIENLQMTKNIFCTSILGYAHHDNAEKLKISQSKNVHNWVGVKFLRLLVLPKL